MRLRRLMILVIVTLLAGASLACSAAAEQKKVDPISGEWEASLDSESTGSSFTLVLLLKLNGDKVTGAYESGHTGGGNVSKGSWAANKLNLTLETNHGAMALTGVLKDGKLVGQWDAGHLQGKWEARKK